MQNYKVLADELVLEGGSSVAKEAVVSLDPESDYAKNALEQGVIELVPAEPAVEQKEGDVCTTEDDKEGTLQGDPLVCVATPIEEKVEESEVVAPQVGDSCTTEDGKPGKLDGELVCVALPPQKFYQKKLVVAEGERTVGEKTYRTVTLIDGSTSDLTDAEYAEQVTVAQ